MLPILIELRLAFGGGGCLNTLDSVKGDGLTGWWQNTLRFEDSN